MKKIFTLIAVAAMAMSVNAQTVIYSWESPEGTPIQSGGTIAYVNGDGDRLNYANGGYHTICLNGKKANLNDASASANAGKMVVTLDQALAAGDIISFTAYVNKNASAESGAYVLYSNGQEAATENFGDAENIHADFGGSPATKTITVTEAAAGSNSFTMTRNVNGTNLFITKLVITRGGANNINVVKAEETNAPAYNLAGQKVAEGYKGIVIKNGKKVLK